MEQQEPRKKPLIHNGTCLSLVKNPVVHYEGAKTDHNYDKRNIAVVICDTDIPQRLTSCRSHNLALLSAFMIYHRIYKMTRATYKAPEFASTF